jgi:hypothetical protein
VAGALVEVADWRVSFLVGAVVAAAGGVLVFARRATLGVAAVA